MKFTLTIYGYSAEKFAVAKGAVIAHPGDEVEVIARASGDKSTSIQHQPVRGDSASGERAANYLAQAKAAL